MNDIPADPSEEDEEELEELEIDDLPKAAFQETESPVDFHDDWLRQASKSE